MIVSKRLTRERNLVEIALMLKSYGAGLRRQNTDDGTSDCDKDVCWFVETALELQQIARQLHRLDEHGCNYGLTDTQETRRARLESKAQRLCTATPPNLIAYLVAYHQGDPRGCSLYIVPSEYLAKGRPVESVYDKGQAVLV